MQSVSPEKNMDDQKKSIIKTIAIIVVLMATILTLFLNKITTPRYLSNIELKVNGLILRSEKYMMFVDKEPVTTWSLIATNDNQQVLLDNFYESLKPSIREQVNIMKYRPELLPIGLVKEGTVPIIKPTGEYIAYLKPPYNVHKMTLTLSSVITHR